MTPRLLHVFATFVPGGPQVRTARLLNALGAEFSHSILALDGRQEARALLADDLDASLLATPPRAGSLRTALGLRRLLGETRPDLVLTYNWGAIDAVLAARLARRPVIHHEDGFRPDEVEGFKRRRVLARRLLLRGTRAVIVPSRTLEGIARELWRVAPERLFCIPNGIGVDDFAPADGNPRRRAELGIPAAAFVVGAVGHLRPEKNFVRLVEAFAALRADPAPHLLLLGDGPERDAVAGRAATLGVGSRVHLVGHREHPRDDYRAMDAFVISSDTEQMPVAQLEAMASALPVAATAVGDVRGMLPDDQAPFVVALAGADTAARLADALARLAADPAQRRRLGAQNRAHVAQHYGFGAMVAAYRARYAAALSAC